MCKKSLVTKLLIKKQSTLAENCILIQKMYEFHCKKIFFIGIWQILFFSNSVIVFFSLKN